MCAVSLRLIRKCCMSRRDGMREMHTVKEIDKVVALFEKMEAIIGDEKLTVKEYAGILDAGIADMEIGIVPPTIDRVVVGDMTRSRLNHIKVLFMAGVNEGIIPKPAKKGRILSGADRQSLEDYGIELAPSDKTNAYIEQFYIYTTLTKASDMIYVLCRKIGEDLKSMKPSYLIDRIKNIFPDIRTEEYDVDGQMPRLRRERSDTSSDILMTLKPGRRWTLSENCFRRWDMADSSDRSISGRIMLTRQKICLQILYALYMERIWWRVCPSLSGMLSASSSIS